MRASAAHQKAWMLAFKHEGRLVSDVEVKSRCDEIESLYPDLNTWDPAGRGPSAKPCQWLLDLIQCAGIYEIGENEEGYEARAYRRASVFYVKMALELSRRAAPSEVLTIDGQTPIPPDVAIKSAAQPDGDCGFSVKRGDIFDALFDSQLMSDSKEHSSEDVHQLILNALRGVALDSEQTARTLNVFIKNNRRHYGCYGQHQEKKIIDAILAASPALRLASLSAGDIASIAKGEGNIQHLLEKSLAAGEAADLRSSLPQRGGKLSPGPRI